MYTLNDKISALRAYTPVKGEGCIRLDANESFLNLPREILEELAASLPGLACSRYPDPGAEALCQAFARRYGVEAENVVAGNGSDELISVIFSAFLMKGEAFATVEPDFSMYAQGGALAEGRHLALGKGDYQIHVDQVAAACQKHGVRLLIFSNPCNPTSILLKKEEVRRLVQSVEALVVLDEAYMDFASGQSLVGELDNFDNLIILRTCSKAVGMAAFRLGFALANRRLSSALRAAKSPYNVNAVSQLAGSLVLNRGDLLDKALETILASRKELVAGLEEISAAFPGNFRILPSAANFAAIVTENPGGLQQALLARGIAVRHTGGLLRVTAGSPEENQLFLKEFRKLWEESR